MCCIQENVKMKLMYSSSFSWILLNTRQKTMFSLKQICSRKIPFFYLIDSNDFICVFSKHDNGHVCGIREKLENFISLPSDKNFLISLPSDKNYFSRDHIVVQKYNFNVIEETNGIHIFDSKLRYIKKIKPSIFYKIRFQCVRVYNDCELVILDKDNSIYITDLDYNEKLHFDCGSGVMCLAINTRGDIYTAGSGRINVFDKNGTHLFDITENIDEVCQIVINKDDLLIILNILLRNLLICSPNGILLQKINLKDIMNETSFFIQIDSKNRIYLKNNMRVTYVFELIQN